MGAYRLHCGLRQAGVQSEMLVLRKLTEDPHVYRLSDVLSRWERAQRRLAERRHQRRLRQNPRKVGSGHWSLNQFDYRIASAINSFGADIVQLHWVGDNFLPIQQLEKIRAPLVWTLRDMWAFSGGCHYAATATIIMRAAATVPSWPLARRRTSARSSTLESGAPGRRCR